MQNLNVSLHQLVENKFDNLQQERDPILKVLLGYNGETVFIMDQLKLRGMQVAAFRELITRRLGIPFSMARLFSEDNREMYDVQTLDAYGIRPRSTLRLETWPGLDDMLNLCIAGFTQNVLVELSTDDDLLHRYQLRVAQYIAAHFNFTDLAAATLRLGARPSDSVGEHPSRGWTDNETERHPAMLRAPVHEAAENGNDTILKLFTEADRLAAITPDGYGLKPLSIAIRSGHRNCAKRLISCFWCRVYVGESANEHISLRIYSRVIAWAERSKTLVYVRHGPEKSSIKKHTPGKPRVGQSLYIKGFRQSPSAKSPNQPVTTKSAMSFRPHRQDPRESLTEQQEQAEEHFKRYTHIYASKAARAAAECSNLLQASQVQRRGQIAVTGLRIRENHVKQPLEHNNSTTTSTTARQRRESTSSQSVGDQYSMKMESESGALESVSGAALRAVLHNAPLHEQRLHEADGEQTKQSNSRKDSMDGRLTTIPDSVAESRMQPARSRGGERARKVTGGSRSQTGGATSKALKIEEHERLKAVAVMMSRTKAQQASGRLSNSQIEHEAAGLESVTARAMAHTGGPSRKGAQSIFPRPYFPIRDDTIKQTIRQFERRCGATIHQMALRSLATAHVFRERSWVAQVYSALDLTRNQIHKVYSNRAANIIAPPAVIQKNFTLTLPPILASSANQPGIQQQTTIEPST